MGIGRGNGFYNKFDSFFLKGCGQIRWDLAGEMVYTMGLQVFSWVWTYQ